MEQSIKLTFSFIFVIIFYMKEIWKQINNSNYFISNFGNIKNNFGKYLKPFESSKYLSVNLFLEKNKSKKILYS